MIQQISLSDEFTCLNFYTNIAKFRYKLNLQHDKYSCLLNSRKGQFDQEVIGDTTNFTK